ncbi:hypothetical protein ZIOFF_017794 [Zingiber officinale]|uniref:Protein kinase domain-containing protein n=1 Tax=Zingiber officinale TaxID=94328 RepID=A0A8J5H5K3_ZINOF|nr:hypothetical protein ZIOFF_017794 [Zingiber officinale]
MRRSLSWRRQLGASLELFPIASPVCLLPVLHVRRSVPSRLWSAPMLSSTGCFRFSSAIWHFGAGVDLLGFQDLCASIFEIEVMARLSGHRNVVDLKAAYSRHLEKHGHYSEHEAAVLFRLLMEVVMYCHVRELSTGHTLSGTVGSPFYIAPETKSRIFESVRSVELQFPSDPWQSVSDSAKDLIRRMLCRYPSQRLTAKQVLDSSQSRKHKEHKEVESTRVISSNSKSGIHSRRNHTIGLGELDQLDLVISDRVGHSLGIT